MSNEELIRRIREVLDKYEILPWAINVEQYNYVKDVMFEFLRNLKLEVEQDKENYENT